MEPGPGGGGFVQGSQCPTKHVALTALNHCDWTAPVAALPCPGRAAVDRLGQQRVYSCQEAVPNQSSGMRSTEHLESGHVFLALKKKIHFIL